jgi:hypothetical protein
MPPLECVRINRAWRTRCWRLAGGSARPPRSAVRFKPRWKTLSQPTRSSSACISGSAIRWAPTWRWCASCAGITRGECAANSARPCSPAGPCETARALKLHRAPDEGKLAAAILRPSHFVPDPHLSSVLRGEFVGATNSKAG